MKKTFIIINMCCLLSSFSINTITAQAGYAINFQNFTFNSHGDFIYCGQPNYGFTNKMTITAWVRWTTDPNNWGVTNHSERESWYSTYIAYTEHNAGQISEEDGQFWLRNAKTGNKIEFGVENVSGTKATASSSTSPLENTWYFLSGVYDGDLGSNQIKLYVNGTQVGQATLTGNIRANTDCRLNMGRLPWGYGFFVGWMDEVRIWDAALSQAEIQAQMSTSVTQHSANLKSYWNFDVGSGTSIDDQGTTNADGVFYSALIDVHGGSNNFPGGIISDPDRGFVTGAWNGKTINTIAGAGVDETNTITSNTGNVFTLQFGFGVSGHTTPVMDTNPNMTWFGVLDGTETTQWVVSDIPLPVELISFTSAVKENVVILNWQTVTEVNNYGFEIERFDTPLLFPSREGKEQSDRGVWETIGFVSGNGNSNSPKEYSFVDDLALNLNPNLTLIYRLKQINIDGSYSYSEVIEVTCNTKLSNFELFQNYPNPFNPTTTIKYSIPVVETGQLARHTTGAPSLQTTLKVYDVLGNEVATLVNETKEPGVYQVEFDGSKLTSGIYFYEMIAGAFVQTQKMLLIK